MTKAIIFDFDGVLCLSELPRFNALRTICTNHGLDLLDDHVPQVAGKTTVKALEHLFPECDPEIMARILKDFRTSYIGQIEKHVEPVALTVDFIKSYTGSTRFAVASMSSMESLEKLLTHFGIRDKISVIISRNEVTHHKPDPEVYLKALELLQLPAHECVAIEDTALGATAAIAAGLPCYVLLNGFNTPADFPEDVMVAGYIETSEDIKSIF